MTLTKADIAESLCADLEMGKKDAKDLADAIFEQIRLALAQGEQVKISGFGNFNVRSKPERPGRNPKTGREVPITRRRVVTFKPGQKLKSIIMDRGSKTKQELEELTSSP